MTGDEEEYFGDRRDISRAGIQIMSGRYSTISECLRKLVRSLQVNQQHGHPQIASLENPSIEGTGIKDSDLRMSILVIYPFLSCTGSKPNAL